MNRRKRRNGNVFELFGAGGGNSTRGETIDRTHYRAYGLETTGAYKGQEEWIYVELNPRGPAHMLRYDHILKMYAPSADVVALILKDETFTFMGRCVDQILLPIQDRRLRSIYLFDPSFHQEPPDNDAKIAQIDHYTREQFERERQEE